MSERSRRATRAGGTLSRWIHRAVPLARENVALVVASARTMPVISVAMTIGLALAIRLAWVHLTSLALPISWYDGHHWRQSFTYGVAWNYAHTTLDVLRPRMFLELNSSNIVAMEPPVYPLLSSILLRLTRDSTVGPRLMSWLALVVSLTILFRWLGKGRADPRDTWADRAGLLLAVSLSPMIAADFRSIQPEPLAAGLSMAAAASFVRYGDTDRFCVMPSAAPS